jgi:UDP-2,3-diacylglucosamine hydrolase
MSTKSCITPGYPIGIIAGSGALFSLVLAEAITQQLHPVIVSFNDFPPQSKFPHLQTSLGKIGEILEFFKTHNIKHLVFAGKVPRPSLTSLGFDATGIKWMQKLGIKAFAGDDALLKGITELLSGEGFQIISPKDFLPTLVLKSGTYTTAQPNQVDNQDIERGLNVLKTLACADVGQACIVHEGLVLGVEAIEGTQNLIERCLNLKRTTNGGVLIKIAKQNQTTLVDLPTIGIETITAMQNCHLNGIAISANTTQVLDFKSVINLCNQHNLFLKVVEA